MLHKTGNKLTDLICIYCGKPIGQNDINSNNFIGIEINDEIGVGVHTSHIFKFESRNTTVKKANFNFIVELVGYLNTKRNGIDLSDFSIAKRENFENNLIGIR